MPSRKAITAEEFARELAQDPAYQARIRAEAESRDELTRACAADEAGLVAELRASGCRVASVWDLAGAGEASGEAAAVLVRHLTHAHHPRIWEGIVRALATRAARTEALEPLRRAYGAEADPGRRWVIANAIGSMARFAEVQDLPDISKYRALFRQSRKLAHVPPAI